MTDRWIETRSGVRFSLSSPRPEDVRIEDVAHGLALLCRYNGQCDRFYSVAEHSVLCACLAKWCGESADMRMACLLHDAAEAYIGDFSGPLKDQLRDWGVPELDLLEDRMMLVVLQGLGLDRVYPLYTGDGGVVQRMDRAVFAGEEARIMASRGDWIPSDWPQPPSERDWIPTAMIGRDLGESWERAEAAFLRHYCDIRMEMDL